MPKRERTDSLTKLCKIIALEVNKPRFERTERMIDELEDQVESILLSVGTAGLVEAVKSSMEKAGEYWTNAEDNLLVDEVEMAIATIAKNHSRSHGAIRARINHKEII